MTPPVNEVDQLKRQTAMLLRALTRVKAERDALARQLAALRSQRAPSGYLPVQDAAGAK